MVDDEPIASGESVGQRLRSAREAKGLSIEDVASSTRIPTRHLQSLEDSDWGKLPAATYSVGFAKNYATAIGLDRGEIADQLRAEMGSELPAHYTTAAEPFEPVDGNRTMPKGLVIGALVGVVLVVILLTWLSNRDLQGNDAVAEAPIDAAAIAPAAMPASQGPVVITANEPAWIEVRDGGNVLKQGELAAGQSFEIPATATAPTLTTAKPEALRISVGTGDAPSIGPAGQKVSNVSLLGPDLLRGPAPSPAAAAPTPTAAADPVARSTPPRTSQRAARPTAPAPRPTPPAAAIAPSPAPVSAAENPAPTTNAN